MGLRVSTGAIIAVLLGGTAYLAQQYHVMKSLLQKREIALSRERGNSEKLKQDILRLESIERGTAQSQAQKMGRRIAKKTTESERGKTANQNLAQTLQSSQKEIVRLKKARARLQAQVRELSQRIAEKTTKSERGKTTNQNLAKERAEEIVRLKKARARLQAQVREMSQHIEEKTAVVNFINDKLNQTRLSLAEAIKKYSLMIARSKKLEKKAREEAERARKLETDLDEMNDKLNKQLITLRRTKNLLRVTIVNRFLFDSGSAALSKKGIETLSKIAEFLQTQKDKMIRIEGHTDNQPIHGNLRRRYPTNWELSSARAISVVKFLESKNISPKRLSAIAYSFHRPATSNDTEEERAKNRRIVILLRSPRPSAGELTPFGARSNQNQMTSTPSSAEASGFSAITAAVSLSS